MRKLIYIIFFAILSMTILSGCKKQEREKIDLSSIHTTAEETETLAPETTAIQITTEAETTASAAEDKETASGSTPTKLTTYKNGKVSIEYPEIYDTGDSSKESAVNKLIKDNALSVLTAYEIDDTKDSLNIRAQVVAADRKRLTILYKGTYTAGAAAYPVDLFFTNTVDLNKTSSIALRDFVDPYTLAGYVLSGDCQFADVTAEQLTELNRIKNDTSLAEYTAMFEKADFPYDTAFPETFSYEKQGNIFFTIPVPHALGDYAMIKFTPDTK